MPWQQLRKIEAQVTHSSDDRTHRVKLPESNVLHSLLLQCEITNGSTNGQSNGMSSVVDWIKVIRGGSQVLYYLEPEHIRVLSLRDLGQNLVETHDEQASAVQKAEYPILFGRALFDEEMYLPLADGQDIELQVKYSPSIAVSGFAAGTFKTTVLGLMTLGGNPGNYQGTITSRIIENFTTAASGVKEITPAQRHRWRRLLVRCYEAAIEDGVDITNVQFDLNDEERVPLNLSWNELHGYNMLTAPVYTRQKSVRFRADADTVSVLVSRIKAATISHATADDITNDVAYLAKIEAIAGDRLTIGMSAGDFTAASEDLTADTTDRALRLEVVGEGLPYTVEVPINARDEPPFFDSRQWDEAKVSLTQSAADGDTDVILQEVQTL